MEGRDEEGHSVEEEVEEDHTKEGGHSREGVLAEEGGRSKAEGRNEAAEGRKGNTGGGKVRIRNAEEIS